MPEPVSGWSECFWCFVEVPDDAVELGPTDLPRVKGSKNSGEILAGDREAKPGIPLVLGDVAALEMRDTGRLWIEDEVTEHLVRRQRVMAPLYR